MTYYNTTHAAGSELRGYQDKALSQDELIMAFFAGAEGFLYTPSEIRKRVFDDTVPLTSVRRSMTNLTNARRLIKTDQMRSGIYGRPEHCWRRRLGKPKQQELFK